jgi:hypothetical protein
MHIINNTRLYIVDFDNMCLVRASVLDLVLGLVEVCGSQGNFCEILCQLAS